jgi:hypothetical protein
MNLAQDVDILTLMAADLKAYLLAEPVFWQMQGPSSFPKLSLGMMLLTQARLEAAGERLSQSQRAERDAAARQIDATLGSWQVAAEKKAERELHTRVNLWQRYWEDCASDPRTCGEQYPHDVTQRVIAGLLLHKFPRLADTNEARALEQLDRLARGRLAGNQFVWGAELQAGFPEAEHWYLYGTPANRQ